MFCKSFLCLIALTMFVAPQQDGVTTTDTPTQTQPQSPQQSSEQTTTPRDAHSSEANLSAPDQENTEPTPDGVVNIDRQSIKIDDTWKRLGKNQIWINQTAKQVMVRGSICLRKGALEMFACPLQTKEHESIVAVEAKSSEIHACLVALGFEPGNPVQWKPKYKSATGPSIKIDVTWMADGQQKTVDAKSWVVKSGTKQTLTTDWVFGGSEIFVDRIDGRKIYYADSGEMVCLSNFPTAMMDVPIQSSDSADGLLFEAHTEVIPAVETQVYLIMTPRQ